MIALRHIEMNRYFREAAVHIYPSYEACLEQEQELPQLFAEERGYYAAVSALLLDEQGALIDSIIRFAFDTIGARHLNLRVFHAED
jgi:hypothetical protein